MQCIQEKIDSSNWLIISFMGINSRKIQLIKITKNKQLIQRNSKTYYPYVIHYPLIKTI